MVFQQLGARQMPDPSLDWYFKAEYDKGARVHGIPRASMDFECQGLVRLVCVGEGQIRLPVVLFLFRHARPQDKDRRPACGNGVDFARARRVAPGNPHDGGLETPPGGLLPFAFKLLGSRRADKSQRRPALPAAKKMAEHQI